MLGTLDRVERNIKKIDRWLPAEAVVTGPLWQPLPGPQTLAYHSPADELYYGGAAGGGKTDLALGIAVTQHLKSIIFRREYPQLKDILLRSEELLSDVARFNSQANIWRSIPGGRILEFGAVQYERDKNKFKGRPHDFYAFDELPEFMESQYRFLIGWARTTVKGQRVRVVNTGNPPTHAEGEWVIRYWGPWLDDQHPNPAEPGELRWFAMIDGESVEVESDVPIEHKGELIFPKSRTFIPARLEDNPYLADTDYRTVLQNLPEPLRSQLLYGDFTVGLEDDPWQVIPTEWVRLAQERWKERKREGPMTALGLDVARGGIDQTVLAPRYGNWFARLEKHAGSSTPDGPLVASLALSIARDGAIINVDVIGVGSSVFDTLVSQDINVVGVNFAERSEATDKSGRLRFRNKRAEAYWRMREALDPDYGDDVALPPDNELLADLVAPHWKLTTSGIQVESKEDIIKRLGRSPDCGDAVVLANFSESPKWRDISFLSV
jgi:hypothetical protein